MRLIRFWTLVLAFFGALGAAGVWLYVGAAGYAFAGNPGAGCFALMFLSLTGAFMALISAERHV